MRSKPLGSRRRADLAGRSLTRIGLGTNRLTDSAESHRFLRAAVDAGVELIDTAHLYAGGESERAIGAALSPFGDSLVVATKAGYRPGSSHPQRLREEIEQSFERLRVETIDLLYLHRVDPEVPLEASVGVLADYREAGRVEHVGLSEVTVDQIERARHLVPIAAVQNEFNLSERQHDEVVDFCDREGILFVPFYPLRGADRVPQELARRLEATPRQLALAWLLRRSPVVAPIPGTLSLDHLRENLEALEIELADEDFERLGGLG
jgi:pyridoxine 4-dehydrogenase